MIALAGLPLPAAATEVDPSSWSLEESVAEESVATGPVPDPMPTAAGVSLLCVDETLKETLEKIALIKREGLPALRSEMAALEKEIDRLREQGLKDVIAKHAWTEALAGWEAQLAVWTNRPSGSAIQHPEKLFGPRATVEARLAEATAAVAATKAAFDKALNERESVAAKIRVLQAILEALEESLEGTSACNEPPAPPVTMPA